MCLIVMALRVHPDYPLVIAANRDEFYHRPTAPLDFWADHPCVLAGRDLQEQGTWLGVTKDGRLAALTNYREPGAVNPKAVSRGLLVSDYLVSGLPAASYLKRIMRSGTSYNGFNLVAGHLLSPDRGLSPPFFWYSNKKNEIVTIPDGVHVISNHLMDTPWPKTRKSGEGIKKMLADPKPVDPESIFRLLADTRRPADEELPDTGVGLEWERVLSSVFVVSPVYGTRSSALILAERSGRVRFFERTFIPGTDPPEAEKTREVEMAIQVEGDV